jgi:uncharacterized protein YhjY with autotransporter beta-barrel domain
LHNLPIVRNNWKAKENCIDIFMVHECQIEVNDTYNNKAIVSTSIYKSMIFQGHLGLRNLYIWLHSQLQIGVMILSIGIDMRYTSLINYCMLAEKTCQSVKFSTFKSWDMALSKRLWENPLEVQLRFTYNLGYTRPSTKSVV